MPGLCARGVSAGVNAGVNAGHARCERGSRPV